MIQNATIIRLNAILKRMKHAVAQDYIIANAVKMKKIVAKLGQISGAVRKVLSAEKNLVNV